MATRAFPNTCRALAWLSASGVALAQAPDAGERLDELLDALDPPSCEALLEPFGAAPSIEELLEPRGDGSVPVLRMALPEGFVPLALELIAERDRLAVEDPEGAYALGTEYAEELASVLGAQHPRVIYARDVVRGIELEADLALEDRRALYDARAGMKEAAGLHAAGRHEEALARYLRCAELELALLGEGARLANALASLGPVLHARGDYARAEAFARAGLDRTVRALGVKHAFVTRSLNDLALLLTVAGRLREAEAYHAHSLALRRELYGDDGPEFALALMHFGDLSRFRNELGLAAAVAERAIGILRATGQAPDRLGILLHQRGVLALMSGADEAARAFVQEAIEVLERAHGGDHRELAAALGALADVEAALGELDRALELAARSHAMHARIHSGPHPLKAQARSRLAHSLAAVGELERAERELRAALAEMEATGVGGRELAAVLEVLASFLARKGDPVAAELQSERALAELRGAFGRSRLVANALRRLSWRQRASGDVDAAIVTLEESAVLYDELLGAEHVRVAQVRVELAGFLFLRGELDEAEEIVLAVLRELEPDARSGAARRARSDATWLAARLALERGELERAASLARQAIEGRGASHTAPHPALVEALALEGAVLEHLGELEQARATYSEALDQADSLRTRILGDERDRALYAGELSLGTIARALARVELALGHPRAALEAAERGRERALLDLLERSGRDLVAAARARGEDAADALEQLLEREAEARGALLAAEQELRRVTASPAVTEARLEALDGRVSSARVVLQRREGELEAGLRGVWPSARPGSADALAAALGPDEALLHYGFDERGLSLVVARRAEGVSWLGLRLADDAAVLRAELTELIGSLRDGAAFDPRRRRALSETLVPRAVWDHIAGCRRVAIVPDGPLHGLPFEALDVPGGAWIEHGPRVTYSPSAALFARVARPARGETQPRAVVLGEPRFGALAGEGGAAVTRAAPSELDRLRLFGDQLEPLPGSAVEARSVASTLEGEGWEVSLLLGSEARAPRLLELARGARLVHLATHGVSASAARPYEAALALTAPDALSAEDDGFLTLDDLVRRWSGALQECELVVLSACDTQVGVPLGESRVALSWGFFFAGARGVLVSLWKVDDRATALLMERFYTSYTGAFDEPRAVGDERFAAGAALPADAALQEAKAWLARSTPAENQARLVALGLDAPAAGLRGDFPRPGARPSSTPTEAAYDFSAPRFGAAFVLYGRSD